MISALRPSIFCAAIGCAACHRADAKTDGDAGPGAPSAAAIAEPPPPPEDAPKVGITAMQVWVHEKPSGSSRKIGYLRLGATVARGDKPVGNDGCSGAWYSIHPRGYVCVGDEATLDVGAPIVRAESARPDLSRPMPYHYGFVRYVTPLYLKVPTKDEQLASEFKLKEHLEAWNKEREHFHDVVPGANDVDLPPGAKKSTDMTDGERFGGGGDDDPLPFWLAGGARSVANVSGFEVPKYAVFANRARRHTGLALIGSFPTGEENFSRRFAITTDLRLVPTDKVKPDTASPFHGIAIHAADELPFAWVRAKEARVFRMDEDGKPHATGATLANRTRHKLTGKAHQVGEVWYRETQEHEWLKSTEAGAALAPAEWPKAAGDGEKWIDISIENQVLVAWEGKTPVYATLVSTGQDGMGDWNTTKSTIRGTFRIRDKHVTAVMDSNGRGAEGGGPPPSSEEGKTVRRGQGTFELRDVPWVQYFAAGFALHAAYWHDVFGLARSHGCVNLSPIDGHFLFGWTEPKVPHAWHGVVAGPDTAQGTVVNVHR